MTMGMMQLSRALEVGIKLLPCGREEERVSVRWLLLNVACEGD